MGVKIDLGAWNGVFVVPKQVVDKDLKLAGTFQLKVLLFLLRHSGEELTADAISEALSIHLDDVKDSISFWIQRGLLTQNDNTLTPDDQKEIDNIDLTVTQTNTDKNITTEKTNPRIPSRPQRPNADYISKRIEQSNELSFLMQESQVILGRLISNSDISILIMLHDNDGLPVDVILMLLEYTKSVGKKSMSYIEKIGIEWANEEIFTVHKAEEKIRELSQRTESWNIVKKAFGISQSGSPTKNQLECSNRWVNDWKYSSVMIREAYERCIDSKGELKLNYIDGIIKKWKSAGIFSLNDLKKAENNKKTLDKNKASASYNIEEYETASIFD